MEIRVKEWNESRNGDMLVLEGIANPPGVDEIL